MKGDTDKRHEVALHKIIAFRKRIRWLPRFIRFPIKNAYDVYVRVWYYNYDWEIAFGQFTSRYQRHKAYLLKHQKVCQHCNTEGTRGNPLTIDHIIPRSKGGGNGLNNKQLLCRKCNSKKADKPNDYRISMYKRLDKFQREMEREDADLWKIL